MQAKAKAKSFIEILEDEIRADLKRELRAELQAELEAGFGTGLEGDTAGPRARRPQNPHAIHAAARLETWLASHVGPITFKTNRKPYGATARSARDGATAGTQSTTGGSAADAASSPRGGTDSFGVRGTQVTHMAETTEETIAVELLSRHAGRTLNTRYTADDLKSIWRKAALKTHPDRFAGADTATVMRATALFRELAAAYELLSSKMTAKSDAATAA